MNLPATFNTLRARLLLVILLPLLGMLVFATIWAVDRRQEAEHAVVDNKRITTIVDAARLQYRMDLMGAVADAIGSIGPETPVVGQFDALLRWSIQLSMNQIDQEVAGLRRAPTAGPAEAAIVERITDTTERMLTATRLGPDSSVRDLLGHTAEIGRARDVVAAGVVDLIDEADDAGTTVQSILDLSTYQIALTNENISVLEAAVSRDPVVVDRAQESAERLQVVQAMTLRKLPKDLRERMQGWNSGEAGRRWDQVRRDVLARKRINLLTSVPLVVDRSQVLDGIESEIARRLAGSAATRADDATRQFRIALGLSIVLLLGGLVVAWLVYRAIRSALGRVTDHAQRIAGGDLDVPSLSPAGGRELALLGGTFNSMTETLRALRGQLHALAEGRDREDEAGLPGELGATMERSMQRVSDITERLRVSEAISRLTIETAVEAIVRLDERGVVTDANPAAAELLGQGVDLIVGKPVSEVVLLEGVRLSGEDVELVTDREATLRPARGGRVNVLISTRRVNTGDGEHRVMLFMRDISDRKRTEERLAWEALHDPLTGLPNRTALDRGLTHEGTPLTAAAVLFIDLDRFKDVNDTLGHEVGDELLRSVAARIRRNVRSNDVVIRMGGDEFVLVRSGGADAAESEQVGHRLIQSLEEPFHIGGHTVSISASVGVVAAEGKEDVAELIRRADQAMYAAKNAGRGRVRRYQPGDDGEDATAG